MNEIQKAGSNLEHDIVNDNLLDIVAEISNPILESIGENIPVVGLFLKGIKAFNSIKDEFLMQKVGVFLNELSTMSQSERENFVNKMNDDPIFGQKAGAFIVTALDRLDFQQKAVYLARASKFFERGDINKNTFIRIKGILEGIELIDIEHWIERGIGYHPNKEEDVGFSAFISAGVLERIFDFNHIINPGRGKPHDLRRVLQIRLSKLGAVFFKILIDQHFDEDDKWQYEHFVKSNRGKV